MLLPAVHLKQYLDIDNLLIHRYKNCSIIYTTEATGAAGYVAVRTCNSYWNPQDAVEETDIGPLLMGMATQITEREDNIITEDLRGAVCKGILVSFSGLLRQD